MASAVGNDPPFGLVAGCAENKPRLSLVVSRGGNDLPMGFSVGHGIVTSFVGNDLL